MSFDDPIRLRVGGSPELRELLGSLAADAPTALEVTTLTAALAPALQAAAATTTALGSGSSASAASTAAGSATSVTSGTGLGVATAAGIGLKGSFVIATIGATVLGGAVAWQRARAPEPRQAIAGAAVDPRPRVTPDPPADPVGPSSVGSAPIMPRAALSAAPAVVTPSPEATTTPVRRAAATSSARTRATAPPTTAPAAPAAPPTPTAPPTLATPRAASAPAMIDESPAAPAPPPAPPRESDLLRRAQRALQREDAQQALELTAAHAAHYPRGTFTQEREAIAIEALARLGRADAASERFGLFVTRFPKSTYHGRLQRLLAAGSPR